MFKRVDLWLTGLAAVVLSAGLGYQVFAQNDPLKKDPPKPEEKKPGQLELDLKLDLDDLLKNLPAGVDAEEFKKAMLELRMQFPNGNFPGGFGGAFGGFDPMNRFGMRGETRLGVVAAKPSETLSEQLGLAKDQGLVIAMVVADSPAAKAGLKAHDLLLEVNGKPITQDIRELKKLIDEIKADVAVDVVVMRKGKVETIKGIKLPEVKPANAGVFGAPGGAFNFQLGFPGVGGFGGGPGTMTSVMRNNDQFQVKQTENGLMLSVSGTIDAGKAKANEIQVIEPGKAPQKFDSLDKVPDTYKEKVKAMIDIAEKGKVETKSP